MNFTKIQQQFKQNPQDIKDPKQAMKSIFNVMKSWMVVFDRA